MSSLADKMAGKIGHNKDCAVGFLHPGECDCRTRLAVRLAEQYATNRVVEELQDLLPQVLNSIEKGTSGQFDSGVTSVYETIKDRIKSLKS